MKKQADPVEATVTKRFLFLASTCVVVPALMGAWLIWSDWPQDEKWTEAGTRGDFWGGHLGPVAALTGSLLFFLALMMQLKQLLMQREELKAQREELGYMREEMAEARKVYDAQREMMERQAAAAEQAGALNYAFQLMNLRLQNATAVANSYGTQGMTVVQSALVDTSSVNDLLLDLAQTGTLDTAMSEAVLKLSGHLPDES